MYVVFVLLAGCAAAGGAAQSDAPPGSGSPDAKQYLDGQIEVTPDARPDAPPDAAVHHDAAIDAPPDACVPMATELLANPAFDLTPIGTGWTQQPIDPLYPDITADGAYAPQSAPYKNWMGGIDGTTEGLSSVTDIVYADVTIPAHTTALVLTGYYTVGTTENPNDAPYDTANVDLLQTNGSPIEAVLAMSNLTNTGATWTQFSHTFTTIPSGTVRLRLTSTNDITNATNFFFDTFSLKATHCP